MAGARRPTSSTALLSDAEQSGASGDYAVMAEFVTDVGERVVERAGVRADSEVLDVVRVPAMHRSRREPPALM
jgi:hypothetical protein